MPNHTQTFPIIVLIFCILLLPSCNSAAVNELTIAFPNLRFVRPVDLQAAPGTLDKLYVAEQSGIIRVFAHTAETATASAFLDIRGRVRDTANEEGLLGFVFHPDYQSNGFFFVNYTASSPRRTIISRFRVDPGNPDVALIDSEYKLLEVEQPYANHNAGQLAFGPDGYLYIGMGDGGSAGDPIRNGQNSNTLLGTMLRIDVNQPENNKPYSIPPDNPFVGVAGFQPEIFAYGLRNPWRFSFDPQTGLLWTGDVGQNDYEEINIITSGGNYGWNIREGSNCYSSSDCSTEGLIDPILAYGRSKGGSVTGGYVYRGNAIPDYQGKYIYADYASGRLWALSVNGTSVQENMQIANTNLHISSFGVDNQNELYICAFDGLIYTLNRPE